RGGNRGAHPSHALAQQATSGVAKLANLEILHPESFHNAITGNRFLQDLAQLSEPALTTLRRMPDLAAKFADGEHDQWKHDTDSQRHFPVDVEHHEKEDDECEALLKKIGEILGKGYTGLLNVVYDGGQNSAGGMMLKKSDGLANDFSVHLIAKIRDGSVAGVLNFGNAKIFRNTLGYKEDDQRDAEDGPHVMDARRKKLI